jgi:adenylate kinase
MCVTITTVKIVIDVAKMVFLGPPGVGKGTHSEMTAKEHGVAHISTGDMLREEVKAGSRLGLEAKGYMDSGKLVPDQLVIDMLAGRIKKSDCAKGFILDGFPRTIAQAEALDKITNIDLVVNMDAAKATILERLTGRWTCRKCGAIYHEKNIRPKVWGICDACGGQLYQRDDQKKEVIEERLKVYEKQTAPLIKYYRRMKILMDFSAEGEKNVVHEKLVKELKKKFGE